MTNFRRKAIFATVAFGVVAVAVLAAAAAAGIFDATRPRLTVAAAQNKSHVRGALKIRATAVDAGLLASGLKTVTLRQGAALIAGANASGPDFIVDTAKIPDGKRLFTITARDKAGNTASWTGSYFVDNTKPRVREAYFPPSPVPVGATAPLQYRVTDNAPARVFVSAELQKPDGTVVWAAPEIQAAGGSLQKLDVPMPAEEGTYRFTLKARDRAGNVRVRGGAVAVANEWDLENVKGHLSKLSREVGVREAGTSGEYEAMEYIGGQLKALGYPVTRQGFDIPHGRRSQNVIAEIAGVDPTQRFVIGAHYDSKPPSPGANDNGSGPAILLETARVLKGKKLRPTIVLAFFGAEETLVEPYGHHYGSRHYVAGMSAEEKRQTIGMLSVDMVGYGPYFNLRHMERGPRSLVDDLLAFAREGGYPLVYKKDGSPYGLSDHEPFELGGMPAAWLQWRPDAALHTAGDTYQHVQWARVDVTGRLVTEYIGSRLK